jgi:hypothetical protein
MPEKKTNIISVRVSDDTKKKLVVESELENITMNTLIGKILTRHVEWDRFAEDIGFVMVTKPFLRVVLESLSDVTIKNIATTTCRTAFKDAVIYVHGAFTVENIIKTLDLWLASSHIAFRHVKKDGSEKFVIQHELGEKWTTYFGTLINALINDVGYKTKNEIRSQQNISFEIEKA